MLDLVLAVEDAEAWHARNMARNPLHYAWYMRRLGARAVARVQNARFGAGLYYNTLMPSCVHRRHLKYGVITVSALLDDLRSWRHLYVAGRAHKPVRVLRKHAGLAAALDDNVAHATAAALLTLGPRFSEEDLYVAAASLSYVGDVRMRVAAEVASKVPSIVRANLPHFRTLYAPAVAGMDCVRPEGALWTRDVSHDSQRSLLRRLPAQVHTEIKNYMGVEEEARAERVVDNLAERSAGFVSKAVMASIGAIVTRSSFQQAVKGVFTAGASTSARYVAAKLRKSLKSRLRTSHIQRLLGSTFKI